MPDAASRMRTSPSLGGSSSIGSTLQPAWRSHRTAASVSIFPPRDDDATTLTLQGAVSAAPDVEAVSGRRTLCRWVRSRSHRVTRADDVRALVQRHLEFARAHTRPSSCSPSRPATWRTTPA